MRLADEIDQQLARRIPCRNVTYYGGPTVEMLNTCDQSSEAEFSVERTIRIQRWLFHHQHPSNCTGQRFAVIDDYPLSGFGSTLHQIVSALARALEDDRIAIYAAPGNWVRLISNETTGLWTFCRCMVIVDGEIQIVSSCRFRIVRRRNTSMDDRRFDWRHGSLDGIDQLDRQPSDRRASTGIVHS
jgi:hypothetical protein